MTARILPLSTVAIVVSSVVVGIVLLTSETSGFAWVLAIVGGGCALAAYLTERREGAEVSGVVATAGGFALAAFTTLILWPAVWG